MLHDLRSDLRYAARTLATSPGFAATAIVTIALGVGINAGIFAVLNGVLFRDLPAPRPRELLAIEQTVQGGDFSVTSGSGTFTLPEYGAYAERSRTLAGMLAHSDARETTLGGEVPRTIYGALVSCNYFDVLETPPVLGRALQGSDCDPAAGPVVVLGHDLWTTAFDSDSGIVGRTLELEGTFFTIVGVAAQRTYGGSPLKAGYFAPLGAEPLLWADASRFADDRARWLNLIGRVTSGANADSVRAELAVIAAQIDADEPGRTTTLAVARAKPRTVPSFLRGPATGAAAVLMTAFGLVLLIACANVANLLLARGNARGREIGIRRSLGATRVRVVRQLLTESALLALAGGVLGSGLALWSLEPLVALTVSTALHPELPTVSLDLDFNPDYHVLAYALALTLGTGLAFGLVPALRASQPDLSSALKQEAAGGRDGGRLRGTLVGVQIALCMALVVATGLLLRGLQSTYSIDPGFAYRDVAHLSFGTDGGPPEVLDERLLEEIAALPYVETAAYAAQTPLGESLMSARIRLPSESEDEARRVEIDSVTSSYFDVLELPIVRGRNFTAGDAGSLENQAAARTAIVSESTARNFWGDADPLGRTLLWGETTLEIVGVAADARLATLAAVDPYYVYTARRSGGELLVKSRADFATTAAGIRTVVQARDATLVFNILPLEANLGWFRGASAMVASLGTTLGGLALVLAAVGVYGVVSYSVAQRYREIGIRMALGAQARDLLGPLLRGAVRPIAVGASIGILAAAALSRALRSVLFGVSPADAIGLGGAVLLVLGVALAAGVLAALPATRAAPTAALRQD